MTYLIPIPTLSDIPEAERSQTVRLLLAICQKQQGQIQKQQEEIVLLKEQIHTLKEQNQALRDEIARLKGQKPKPTIKPSALEKPKPPIPPVEEQPGKRAGSDKRKKTAELEIHEEITLTPDNLPEGSHFNCVWDYTIQDLLLKPHNITYHIECWETPDGQYISGTLPPGLGDGHFGPTVISFILYQYYHAQVTQPLIWEQLIEFGVDISSGQVNRIITEKKDQFHLEKEEILKIGLTVSKHLNVDDTGARHQGKNGYCTHIGNQWFAWFESTSSKSRINFLSLLRAGHIDYVLNEDAIAYMEAEGLPKTPLTQLKTTQETVIKDEATWLQTLQVLGIRTKRHIQIATEGALLGSVIHHGFNTELVILSDDAGQFNVLCHALCWIHAERTIAKLVGFSEEQRQALKNKRTEIWDFYADLKAYKLTPNEAKKAELENRFDQIFTEKTCFVSLNKALMRLHKNKTELLLVLERPDIPLHNNESERDIREYVKKRKISGSTRSELGRRCRDTFASLKKTCRKLGISFWNYLNDRVSGKNKLAPLPEVIKQRAGEAHA